MTNSKTNAYLPNWATTAEACAYLEQETSIKNAAMQPMDTDPRFKVLVDRMKATPGFEGWARLWHLLDAARNDPMVKASPGASEFAELVFDLASDCYTTSDAALKPLFDIQDSMRGEDLAARRHALNREAKAWVLGEWQAHAEGYARNKSEFARHYARRLLNERGVEVTDRSIREKWLKGL